MKFESQQKRNMWAAFGIRWLIEYVAIYILLKLFASEWDKGDKLVEAFFGLLILWGIEIALSLKNAVMSVIIYKWKAKEEMVESILGGFKKNKLPKPSDYYTDADGYIDDVLNNDKSSQEAKNLVSVISGVLLGYRTNNMLVAGMLYQFALEEAIKRYQATFPIDE